MIQVDPNENASRNSDTFGILRDKVSYFTKDIHSAVNGMSGPSSGGGPSEGKSSGMPSMPSVSMSVGDLNMGGGSGRGNGNRNNNSGGSLGSSGQSTTKI